ncbi:Nuclear pore complex protein Nup93-1 [Pseudolycoriella hygida]|uniref:Nuclear pore protein n=1 Tax=Pseudolycoriella hygida TaxID=35572 RepID=A0A9Q0RZE1_9DIPT|nr:Nuclear pore complex protein Nup93-1 [Pseudolycoriella hygida]
MDFNYLLQQAQKLTHETQGTEDFPRVERTLPQVLQATHELHSRVIQTGAKDIQAHILLGSKGIELPKISQKLETISSRKTFEPLDPIAETDIQSFLRNEKENAILSVIEEVHKNSYQSAQTQKWKHTMNDWKQEKIKLMNALIGPSQNWIDIRKAPEQTILNESTFGGKSSLNNQEMAYAREVAEHNKLIISGAMRPSLVEKFSEVATKFNDSKVNDMWELVKYMTNVPPFPKTQDPIKTRNQKTQFVDQAKKYLENRYKLFMTAIISDNLREAQRGGVPSTYNLVSAFVGLKFNNQNTNSFIGLQDGFVDGKPLWPLVYYSLRCGDIQSALKFLGSAGLNSTTSESYRGHEDFVQLLECKLRNPEQKIDTKLEMLIKMQYKKHIRNATDQYKRAAYCIVGRCDVNEQHVEVAKTSDDFLWIQLSMIRNDGEVTSDDLTYSGLQSMILEQYGEKHYNAQEQPHLYFQVLTLTGQFEAAIEFLSRFERYRTHAVHIALAMSEINMLGGSRNVQEPLLSVDISDPAPLRRINIARLVMLYVRKFEVTDPSEAIQYFFFLRHMPDPEGRNLFLVCVTDLAIECRDFDLLFGKMQSTGVRSRGIIDQFETVHINPSKACGMVAGVLVKKGLFEDAIKLFDLAGMQEQALTHLSILLSQVVHQPSTPGSLRERLHLMADDLARRYTGFKINCDPQIMSTFTTLRDLVTFFDCYHEKKYELALETLGNTKLVPLSMNDLEICVHNFKRLGGEVCKVIPDLLLATMDVLYNQYKQLKGKDGGAINNEYKERQLTFIRDQAKALSNMAATVPYRMPGDTNSRLVQTEILMH